MPSCSFNMMDFALNYDATLRLFDSEEQMKHISYRIRHNAKFYII